MHIVLLGNGITGASAALRLRELLPDARITMVSGESTHPWSRPALMYVALGQLGYRETKLHEDQVWRRARIELVRGWVDRLDPSARRLGLVDGRELDYDALLLATGAKAARHGWPGQDLEGVQGFVTLMDLERLSRNLEGARRAVVVGGGLIGIELAEVLHDRGLDVTMLVREDRYWGNVLPHEEGALVGEELARWGIGLRLGTELAELVDDGAGRVRAARTGAGDELSCELVGLTAGVVPNAALAAAAGLPVRRGVRVDASLRTPVDGIWAAGDCAELTDGDGPGLVQQVWYTGKAQGEAAAASIAAALTGGEARAYAPGTWYNSAKFLDLEYQVYGDVAPDGDDPAGQRQVVWREGRRLLRLAHRDGVLEGVACLGLRLRHLVCEAWLHERRDVPWVLERLDEAVFDPEFTRPVTPSAAPALAAAFAAQAQVLAAGGGGAR